MLECPYGAGNLADCDIVNGALHAFFCTRDLIVKHREFESKCCWLCMNAMRATDDGSVLELSSADSDGLEQISQGCKNQFACLCELHAECRINDVARRHSQMEVSSIGTSRLCDIRQKRNDVMLGLAFDLIDSLHIETRFLADFIRSSRGNDAKFLLLRSSKEFYFKPDFVAVLVCPNGAHFSARVARDHTAKLKIKLRKRDLTIRFAA